MENPATQDWRRPRRATLACALLAGVCFGVGPAHHRADMGDDKPTLSVKATPLFGFAPAKVRFVADVKGGPNDNKDLYCASVEWVWDDDTTSESSADCEPYEAGKSTIQRRFTSEHEYKVAGVFRVQLRLKQKSKVVLSGIVQVEISPGIRHSGPSPALSF